MTTISALILGSFAQSTAKEIKLEADTVYTNEFLEHTLWKGFQPALTKLVTSILCNGSALSTEQMIFILQHSGNDSSFDVIPLFKF